MQDFSFVKSNGEPLRLSDYRGSVVMIVNTASQCGFTPQYAALESLYNKYKDRGFVVIAVPCDDFGHQEPGTDAQIQEFCQLNFGVTFPVVKKVKVKGEEAHPFFTYAKDTLGFTSAPRWNFYKYLIDKQGRVVDFFASITKPDSPKVIQAIEQLLTKTGE